MNKKMIASAAVLALSAAAFAADAQSVCETLEWDASLSGKVCTGFGDWTDYDTDQSGYWFDYNDANDGGTSSITYGVTDTTGYYGSWYNAMADVLGEIKVTANLSGTPTDASGTSYKPFVGIGFNLSASGDAATVDASAWASLNFCLSYTADANWTLELGADDVTAYNNFKTTLKSASSGSGVAFPLSGFAQETGWGTKTTLANVLASLTNIKFKYQAAAGSSSTLELSAVSVSASCTNSAIPSVTLFSSSAKAQLNDRALSFTGIHSSANVEVLNLQGQVVKSAVIHSGSTMDLSSLNTGLYMVRVSGKSVNLNQKIVLK